MLSSSVVIVGALRIMKQYKEEQKVKHLQPLPTHLGKVLDYEDFLKSSLVDNIGDVKGNQKTKEDLAERKVILSVIISLFTVMLVSKLIVDLGNEIPGDTVLIIGRVLLTVLLISTVVVVTNLILAYSKVKGSNVYVNLQPTSIFNGIIVLKDGARKELLKGETNAGIVSHLNELVKYDTSEGEKVSRLYKLLDTNEEGYIISKYSYRLLSQDERVEVRKTNKDKILIMSEFIRLYQTLSIDYYNKEGYNVYNDKEITKEDESNLILN